jgi:hypothetical protein
MAISGMACSRHSIVNAWSAGAQNRERILNGNVMGTFLNKLMAASSRLRA